MAAKKTPKTKRAVSASRPLKDRVADVALQVAARDGWNAVTLTGLADSVHEPFGKVVEVFPTTDRVAAHLLSRIDAIVLGKVQKVDSDERARDRLFEVLMMRFDALQESRDGYAAILRSMQRRPLVMLTRVPGLLHSMALMLIASGISTSGRCGFARVHALAAAHTIVLRAWLKDDSSDMAQTMSALDKNLDRLEQLQTMFVKPSARAKPS